MFLGCSKDEPPMLPNFNFTLQGWFLRDTAIKTDGLKGIHFTPEKQYCWLRVINNQDSLTCFGSYKQTSDSTLLWNDKFVVNFKIKPVDSIAGLWELRVATVPPSAPLYGPYQQY